MTSVTIGLLVSCLLILISYDMYVLYLGGTEETISHLVFTWTYDYPIFTFACGMLCGHLFWRIRDTKKTKEISDETRN